ncbi:MAG: hypothetical protein GY944_12845, partial [bacterium]|nr:hypothetical protein [bacterium]
GDLSLQLPHGAAPPRDRRSQWSGRRKRWVEEHATRRHHLALSPVFVRLGPEYVRLYSKTVVLGPDPDGLHKDRGHAIRVLRLYVHDFVYEDGAWKFHLYFDV